MKNIRLILLFLFFTTAFLSAQEDLKYKHPFWLSAGLGGSPEFLNYNLSFSKTLEKYSYQVSFTRTVTDFPLSGVFTSGMGTVSFSLGLSDVKIWRIISAYAGPSVSYGKDNDNSKQNVSFWGTGVSFGGQIYFMPHVLLPGLGIGVDIFYNYNMVQSERVNYRNVFVLRLSGIITNLHDKPK